MQDKVQGGCGVRGHGVTGNCIDWLEEKVFVVAKTDARWCRRGEGCQSGGMTLVVTEDEMEEGCVSYGRHDTNGIIRLMDVEEEK